MGYRAKTKIELKRFNVSIFFAKLPTIAYITLFLSFLPPYRAPLARVANFSSRPIPHLGACSQARHRTYPPIYLEMIPVQAPKLSPPLNDSQPGLIPKLTPKRIGVRAIFCQGRGGGGGGMRVIQCSNIGLHMK